MFVAERRGSGIQIVERIDIDPSLRHRDDQVRMAKGELFHRCDKLIPQRQFLLHKICASDAQMDAPCGQFAGNFTRRQQDQRHAVYPFDSTRVLTFGSRALQGDPPCRKPFKGFLHQTPFGGHTEFDRH